MDSFIERINKLAVDTGDGSPNIIGSNLVILEFKDFIRKLKEKSNKQGFVKYILIKDLDKLSGYLKSRDKRNGG